MQLAVTLQQKDQEELKSLIVAVRNVLSADSVTVWEAPADMNYPYPMPILMISENATRRRLYGNEAMEKLRDLAQQR
jgi:hypothetical protein